MDWIAWRARESRFGRDSDVGVELLGVDSGRARLAVDCVGETKGEGVAIDGGVVLDSVSSAIVSISPCVVDAAASSTVSAN